MVGRRRLRGASTSTVTTVDERSIQYLKEEDILKPAPPDITQNEWACFLLTDAVVYDKHGAQGNLLLNDLHGPFMLRGLLHIEEHQSKNLVRGHTKTRTAWIEVPKITSFSIGLSESGMPVLWAAGTSAHFEIVPSEAYTSLANTMFQGISMHYHILQVYEDELEAMKEREQLKPKHKRRRLRLQDVDLPLQVVWLKYVVAVGDGSTVEEVEQRCLDQGTFLLIQFPKGTKFHDWLGKRCPDIVKMLATKEAEAISSDSKTSKAKRASSRQGSSSSERHDTKNGSRLAQRDSRAQSNPKIKAEVVDISSDDQRTSRARSTRAQQKLSPEVGSSEIPGAMEVDNRDITHKSAANVPESGSATANSDNHLTGLPALIEVLDELREDAMEAYNTGHKQKKHPDSIPWTVWSTRVYLAMSISAYAAKTEVLEYYAAGLARGLSPKWSKSELYKWVKANKNNKPKTENISESALLGLVKRQKNPNIRETNPGGKKTKPEGTGGKKPPRGRLSGKAAGLRPSLGGKKRLRSSDDDGDGMDVDDSNSDVPAKKAKKAQFTGSDGEIEEVNTSTTSSSEEEDEQEMIRDQLTRVVIHAEGLPSMSPTGPNHTWTCEEPECGYIVRNAHDEDGQAMIRQHYEAHDKEASDEAKERELSQINLAMQESRGHMPINHLLDKIRQASSGTKLQNPQELNGHMVAEPIKRSLLI